MQQVPAIATDQDHALTFTCVHPGSGYRIGIDRDANGVADGDQLALSLTGIDDKTE